MELDNIPVEKTIPLLKSINWRKRGGMKFPSKTLESLEIWIRRYCTKGCTEVMYVLVLKKKVVVAETIIQSERRKTFWNQDLSDELLQKSVLLGGAITSLEREISYLDIHWKPQFEVLSKFSLPKEENFNNNNKKSLLPIDSKGKTRNEARDYLSGRDKFR